MGTLFLHYTTVNSNFCIIMKLINIVPAFAIPLVLGDSKPEYNTATKSVNFTGGKDQIFTAEQTEALFGEKKTSGRGRGNERGLDKSIVKWPWNVELDGYVINYYVENSLYPSERVPILHENLKWVKNELAELNVIINDCIDLEGCKKAKKKNSATFVRIINDACYSYLGQVGSMEATGGQVMGVGWCYSERGSMLHEFTHCLGFIHEHQRFDRGTKLTIPELTPNSSKEELKALGYDSYADWNANCGKYNEDAISYSGTEYDAHSIMQYPKGGCGIKFIGTEMDLAQRTAYTSTDKLEISTQYPYLGTGTGGSHVEVEATEIIVPNDCLEGDGRGYRGDISSATAGAVTYNCAKWSIVDSPEDSIPVNVKKMATYVRSKVLDRHLKDHNYCRNYDGDSKPWCMTNDRTSGWVYCDIPICGAAPAPTVPAPPTTKDPVVIDTTTCLVDANDDGSNYQGSISTTSDGQTCSNWADIDSLSLPYKFKHYLKLSNIIGNSNNEKNYCRNSDGDDKAWCIVSGSELGYGYCDIPICASENCPDCEVVDPNATCITGSGSAYRGTESKTKSGYDCVNWTEIQDDTNVADSLKNYIKNKVMSKWTDGTPDHNYCRNYDNDKKPWCVLGRANWEYCKIDACPGTSSQYHRVSKNTRKKGAHG